MCAGPASVALDVSPQCASNAHPRLLSVNILYVCTKGSRWLSLVSSVCTYFTCVPKAADGYPSSPQCAHTFRVYQRQQMAIPRLLSMHILYVWTKGSRWLSLVSSVCTCFTCVLNAADGYPSSPQCAHALHVY